MPLLPNIPYHAKKRTLEKLMKKSADRFFVVLV